MQQYRVIVLSLLSAAIVVLVVLNMVFGSVSISLSELLAVLSGETVEPSTRFIILDLRLPQALTAMLSGAALAASGLLLQTAFRNPLAGPDVFGINSGAGLGVALVMLLMGGTVSTTLFTVSGFLAVLLAAFVGAMVVTAIIFGFSLMIRSHVMLLIVGLMIGYLSSSVITLLNFFASAEGVRSYMMWGMGNFSGVAMSQLPYYALVVFIGLLGSILLIKPLNTLLLGDQYAANLGVRVRRIRNLLLIVTGLLTAIVTAFCGPIAFIGLAVPHIARLVFRTENHRLLLPATMLTGSAIALLCNLVCNLPGTIGVIPVNAVTPLLGAPVIIYVIAKRR